STRSVSPTAAPGGRIEPSRTPRGSRAPAARQVHEPSGVELVSSISMRMDMACQPTASLADHPAPYARKGTGTSGYRRAMPIYALGDQVPDIDASAYVH